MVGHYFYETILFNKYCLLMQYQMQGKFRSIELLKLSIQNSVVKLVYPEHTSSNHLLPTNPAF